eukprot:363764-Chlamydomonas_euryale.AAC.6
MACGAGPQATRAQPATLQTCTSLPPIRAPAAVGGTNPPCAPTLSRARQTRSTTAPAPKTRGRARQTAGPRTAAGADSGAMRARTAARPPWLHAPAADARWARPLQHSRRQRAPPLRRHRRRSWPMAPAEWLPRLHPRPRHWAVAPEQAQRRSACRQPQRSQVPLALARRRRLAPRPPARRHRCRRGCGPPARGVGRCAPRRRRRPPVRPPHRAPYAPAARCARAERRREPRQHRRPAVQVGAKAVVAVRAERAGGVGGRGRSALVVHQGPVERSKARGLVAQLARSTRVRVPEPLQKCVPQAQKDHNEQAANHGRVFDAEGRRVRGEYVHKRACGGSHRHAPELTLQRQLRPPIEIIGN